MKSQHLGLKLSWDTQQVPGPLGLLVRLCLKNQTSQIHIHPIYSRTPLAGKKTRLLWNSLCSSHWPWTYSNPPASASYELGLNRSYQIENQDWSRDLFSGAQGWLTWWKPHCPLVAFLSDQQELGACFTLLDTRSRTDEMLQLQIAEQHLHISGATQGKDKIPTRAARGEVGWKTH